MCIACEHVACNMKNNFGSVMPEVFNISGVLSTLKQTVSKRFRKSL